MYKALIKLFLNFVPVFSLINDKSDFLKITVSIRINFRLSNPQFNKETIFKSTKQDWAPTVCQMLCKTLLLSYTGSSTENFCSLECRGLGWPKKIWSFYASFVSFGVSQQVNLYSSSGQRNCSFLCQIFTLTSQILLLKICLPQIFILTSP